MQTHPCLTAPQLAVTRQKHLRRWGRGKRGAAEALAGNLGAAANAGTRNVPGCKVNSWGIFEAQVILKVEAVKEEQQTLRAGCTREPAPQAGAKRLSCPVLKVAVGS